MTHPNHQCGHNRQLNNGMCFNKNDVDTLRKAYLQAHPQDSPPKHDAEFIQWLEHRFPSCKKNHRCLLQQPFIKKQQSTQELVQQVFLPKGPSHSEEWLNTTHINTVMNQIAEKHENTLYAGTYPSNLEDFGLGDLNFGDLQKEGYHRVAMVVNTDPSWKSGQHWVALWTDFQKGHVYYWDSVGNWPPPPMLRFMSRCVEYMVERDNTHPHHIEKKYDIHYNTHEIQKENSQCGVYCVYTLTQLMKGRPYRDIIKEARTDKEMAFCRDFYWEASPERKKHSKHYHICH